MLDASETGRAHWLDGISVRAYWIILKTCLAERLMYRGDFAFATLMRFLPIVTQIFLWTAIYSSAVPATKEATPSAVETTTTAVTEEAVSPKLHGYSLDDMIAYYLLAMVGRAFSSMPGLAGGVAREVRDGTVKKYLTQPIDMLGYLFCARVAHKLVYYIVATIPFALVFYLCRSYFTIHPDWPTIIGFVASLLIAFLVGFLLESLIGFISFWFLEVSSLIFIYMMLSYFLSGHMLPLDWFPEPLSTWVQYLPFKYLAHFPAAVMLGKYPHGELFQQLGIAVIWILVLLVANRLVFARGVRRYGAFGG